MESGETMTKYVLKIEAIMEEKVARAHTTEVETSYFRERILWLSHERLCHLLVMLTSLLGCALFLLAYLYFQIWGLGLLALILLVLSAFYVRHYYFLENHLQHWYFLAEALENNRPR